MQRRQGEGSPGGWMPILSSGAGTVSHAVTGLTNGDAYGFRVRAVNSNGVGPPSDEKTATPSNKTITLSAAATSITEGDSGTKDVTFTVTLGQPVPAGTGGFKISVVLADGRVCETTTATTPGSDRQSNPCTPPLPTETDFCFPDGSDKLFLVAIAEGETRGTGAIRIVGDTRQEEDETIVPLADAKQNTPPRGLPDWRQSSAPFVLTIEDDDAPSKTLTLTSDQTNDRIVERDSGTKDVTLTIRIGQAAPAGRMRVLVGT